MSQSGQMFEYHVSGTAYRTVRSNSSSKKLEKKVTAYSKAEIYNNPADFGFLKIHKVVEIHK